MSAIVTELQAVLREAAQAQELEDEQLWTAAIDVYYRAACQLSYVIDMHIDKEREAALAELLCALHSQYERRVAVRHWQRLPLMIGSKCITKSAVLQAMIAPYVLYSPC
jgi:hypothetical protein